MSDSDAARTSDAAQMNSVFLDRWSPRSFSDEPVTDDEIAAVFEAARWSPSCFNEQPWYYLYGVAPSAEHEALAGVLMERNRLWAQQAPVVGLVIARTSLDGFLARSRDFDAGLASMALTMQATMLGLSVHMMVGIELEAAHELAGVDPEVAKIVCGFALGRRGERSALPPDLAEREQPSGRKPVAEFAFRAAQLPKGLFG